MDNEGDNKKEVGDSGSSDSDIPKPIWVRHSGLSDNSINTGLLEYNAYIVFIGTPILWVISLFI